MLKWIFLFFWVLFVFLAGNGTNYKVVQDANIRTEPSKEAEISYTATSGETFLGKKENEEWIKIKEFKITTKNADGISDSGVVYGYIHNSLVHKKLNWTKIIKTLSDEGYDTVTRVDEIKNRRGETIATRERQEQVHMTTNYYRIDCKCKKCGHEWYYITSHRFEG